jgi:hypothetical protein
MNKAIILSRTKHFIQGLLLGIVFFLILVGSLFLWWWVRPSTYQVNSHLDFTNEVYVTNGRHNANTDLIYWNGFYYFIYANQPGNQGSTTTFLSVNRGADLHAMTEIMQLRVPGEDIRDPKFAIIDNQIFIYYLKNNGVIAIPYGTAFLNSSDGVTWSTAQALPGMAGWCLWRPRTRDNVTWYCSVYKNDQTDCSLFRTTDGINWTFVSKIANGVGISEDELIFLEDGRMLVSIRNELNPATVIGDVMAGTLLAISAPPYTTWNVTLEKLTKLDGPCLFNINDTSTSTMRYFAVGRFQPEVDNMLTAMGSCFAKKRTSLFEFVNLSTIPALRYISDLPSSGDSTYEGVVIKGDRLYITYYTNDPTKDPAWLLGMLIPSDIMLTNMSVTSLLDAANNPLAPNIVPPWDNYIIVGANAGFIFIVIFWLIRKHSKK